MAPVAPTGWTFQPRESTDLWYHMLAVIAADQPGPLGLYSADYASHIREVKRDLGVFPTRLDSLASDLNKRIGDGTGTLQVIHFLPLYVPALSVADLFALLEEPDGANGIKTFGYRLDSRVANIVREIGRVMRHEYEVFFQDYWKNYEKSNRYRYDAVQTFWDRALGTVLDEYLDDRRLNGGLAMPSPPVGPEGRITNPDPTNRTTNVVAMQFPLSANRPEATAFFFLKELCFLIVDDRAIGRQGSSTPDFENQQRTAAVRCGAIILDEYDPVLALQYRRAFLDAVGAEESATKAAFDRVYYLDPSTLRRVEVQVLFPR